MDQPFLTGERSYEGYFGAGYFDEVLMAVAEWQATTAALKGSTEEQQFQPPDYNEDIVPL